jgi:hypothetical protein
MADKGSLEENHPTFYIGYLYHLVKLKYLRFWKKKAYNNLLKQIDNLNPSKKQC